VYQNTINEIAMSYTPAGRHDNYLLDATHAA
jgi:hypothetical protein